MPTAVTRAQTFIRPVRSGPGTRVRVLTSFCIVSIIIWPRRGWTAMPANRRRHPAPRLSYWRLRRFVLAVLPNGDGGRMRFATLIDKVARRYGARAFLASPRNERNLNDVVTVLLLSKRFRLALVWAAAVVFRTRMFCCRENETDVYLIANMATIFLRHEPIVLYKEYC